MTDLKLVLEAILFASQKPLSVADLKGVLARAADQSDEPAVRAFKRTKTDEITAALAALRDEQEAGGRSYCLTCVAEAWQFVARPEFAPWLRVLAGERARPARLSPPALETLTIIAYRQPCTRAEIEAIRGVNSDRHVAILEQRGLIEQAGTGDGPGRPKLYRTTIRFLEHFGISSPKELPPLPEEPAPEVVNAEV